MAGIDDGQRNLIFPPRFVPYMEKHRIFELFHELTELLVQERPKDHIKFLKDALPCAAKRRNKPRIVFLAPPSFNREKFAEEVARRLGILAITRFYLEMKERERKMLERLKMLEAMRQPPSEEETISCVCPGETEPAEYGGGYELPEVYGEQIGEATPEVYESTTVSEVVEEEEDPCHGLRVCICVRQDVPAEAEAPVAEDATDNAADPGEDRIPTGAVPSVSPATTAGEEKTSETVEPESCVCESSESVIIDLGVLGKCEYSEKGWILVDIAGDAREAELLSEAGTVPTHAIRILTDSEEEKTREYKYMSRDWSTVYRSIPVTDIHVNGRSIPQLADSVSRLLRIMPHRHAPMLPRVVLIGSRGSGATTQAKLLSTKYRMVHVEFEEEMARVVLQDDNLSKTYKRQLLSRPDPELEAAILEKILLTPRCRKRGWVLTGYPTNSDQMRMMDLWATPPNRIIFIEVPARECFIRLYYRQTDSQDGRQYRLPPVEPLAAPGLDPEVAGRLMSHPRDDKRQIIYDIERYFEEKEGMMKYCGETASRVNGNKGVESVFELIDQIIINPAPSVGPRDPLAVCHEVEEAHDRLKSIRTRDGMTLNNLLLNPPDPIFKI